MTKPYEATIEGQKCGVNGFSEQGNLVLADGQHYTFERLNFNPPGQTAGEPAGDIFGWPLLEVIKLRRESGDWFLNDEPLPLQKWMRLESQRLYTRRGIPAQYRTLQAQIKASWHRAKPGELHPQYITREILDVELRHLPSAVQEQINGVAWFKHDDGADGWNTPILLKSFRPLPPSAKPEEIAQAAASHLKNAGDAVAKQIRSVNSELRANTEQLAEVAQPFREMYKDQRLAGAKADALRAGIPELVVDVIVSFYHKSKLPTTDALVKYLNSSGDSTKLESAGQGTSRATIGRWLTEFKKIMRRRGLIQNSRRYFRRGRKFQLGCRSIRPDYH
jgi:hypothetical protein